jgi:hypothetical protein
VQAGFQGLPSRACLEGCVRLNQVREIAGSFRAGEQNPKAGSFLPSPIFRDVHNFVLKNKKIGSAFAGHPST